MFGVGNVGVWKEGHLRENLSTLLRNDEVEPVSASVYSDGCEVVLEPTLNDVLPNHLTRDAADQSVTSNLNPRRT